MAEILRDTAIIAVVVLLLACLTRRSLSQRPLVALWVQHSETSWERWSLIAHAIVIDTRDSNPTLFDHGLHTYLRARSLKHLKRALDRWSRASLEKSAVRLHITAAIFLPSGSVREVWQGYSGAMVLLSRIPNQKTELTELMRVAREEAERAKVYAGSGPRKVDSIPGDSLYLVPDCPPITPESGSAVRALISYLETSHHSLPE